MALVDVVGGRFEVQQQVGSGGTSRVFRARDQVSGQTVAVKIVSDTRGQRSERFAREVELLAELVHPGIVRYIAHGETPDGELFLAMEWLDGEELEARLHRGPLTTSEAIQLAARVAEALGAAHARGVVHRDLKPSNLFLPAGQIDQVKVLDFGISRREGNAQITQTGTLLGTPGYMAPEQARDHCLIDARADVFALGCVLFHCLTGVPPFEGDSPMAMLGQLLFGQISRVSALRPDVPEELDALVAQMLARDPALRPRDGANLAAALAALGPVAHSSVAAPERSRAAQLPALIGGERRLFSVVLLGPPAPGGDTPAAPDDVAAAALLRAVRSFGGRPEQLAGGSVIVVLEGDRQLATDQAAQAARCALALRDLAAGRALAIAMSRADSTVKLLEGDVIDRAARLLVHPAPPPGTPPPIALDDMIAGLLDARFEVHEDDAGLRLSGERALVQGARTLLGRPTACVGRDWEIGALAALFDECLDEAHARAVVVTAPPGMGKSRLAAELIGRIQRREDAVAIWIGRGDSLRAGSTLDLLAQALRGALGIRGGEPLDERRAQIQTRVAERVPATERQRVTEFLGELVGTPFPDGAVGSVQLRAARQDAQLMSEQMRNAWLDFLWAEVATQPVLLILEDLHWGDFATVRFIDAALRERGDSPWMVLALARPEVFETFPKLWAERQHVQEIRLKGLGKKACERLVRQVLGDRIGQDSIERLVCQADGNAFYLEELIRAAAGDRAGDKAGDQAGALPQTVLAMVETRLAQLPLEARQVLRAASVFGQVSWERGVAMLLGGTMAAETIGDWLTRLVDQEVLAIKPASRFPDERELVFRHALLREGAYATLTDNDRRSSHRLAGEWLELHGETDPMVLAGHFERGGDAPRAAGYYLRATEQAFYVLDLEATQARVALGLRCEPPAEIRFALLGMRCEVFVLDMQHPDAGMAAAEELIRAAPRGSIPWAQALGAFIQGAAVAGRISDLLASIELLRDVEPAPEALGRTAFACNLAICILEVIGHVAAATELEARFFTTVRPTRDGDPVARFWWNLLLAIRGAHAHDDPWTALKRAEENQAILEVTGGERPYLITHLFKGMNLAYLGALEPAAHVLERIAAGDATLGLGSSLRRFGLAWLRADMGALDEARAIARSLCDHARAQQVAIEEGRARWVLAEVLRRSGAPSDLDAAERELVPALGMLVPFDQPGARATLAAIRLAQGRAAEALAIADDAAARCTAMGGANMFRGAFVRLVRAEAHHATGAYAAARRAIADARARLLAIADRIPDPAYRRSFLENVPENARTLALAHAWLGEAAPSA